MSAQEKISKLEVFERVTQENYQEAAKQPERAARSRLASQKLAYSGPGQTSSQVLRHRSRSQQQSDRIENSRKTRLWHERRLGVPAGCPSVQESALEMRPVDPDAQPTLCSSDVTRSSPTFFMSSHLTPISWVEDNTMISGPESVTISRGQSNQDVDHGFSPSQPVLDFQEMGQGGQLHPYWNWNIHGISAQNLPMYDLPIEANGSSLEFPLTESCQYPDFAMNFLDENLLFFR